ncbi:MAG TPA: glycosyltransferase, partial [Ktedonobacterales bacterium]|nr:glycosyltransferase [Ktedonobacterales bacterium]
AQEYPAVEIVVVNDGGPSVEEVIARFGDQHPTSVTLVNLTHNGGIAVSRNAGAARAAGAYLALLDDDDRFRPTHIGNLVRALERDHGAVLAYDDALIQLQDSQASDEQIHVTATCRFGLPYDKAKFDVDDFIVTSACLIRKQEFAAVGGFNESLRYCEDWDLLLRLRERGSFLYVPGEIGIDYSMRMGANDHTGNVFDEQRRAALDYLSQRYGLPPLVPKNFLDVALGLGFTITPAPTA